MTDVANVPSQNASKRAQPIRTTNGRQYKASCNDVIFLDPGKDPGNKREIKRHLGSGRLVGSTGDLGIGGSLSGRLSGLGLVSLALLGSISLTSGGLALGGVGRRPEGQVVAEELHDESAVPVGLLGQRVELGDGVIKGLLGQVARTVGRVQDLVVEDGEVEGKTQANRVGRGELGLGNVGGALEAKELSEH